jgi:hypothetical protein
LIGAKKGHLEIIGCEPMAGSVMRVSGSEAACARRGRRARYVGGVSCSSVRRVGWCACKAAVALESQPLRDKLQQHSRFGTRL